MLNRVKKQVLPMLESIAEAVAYMVSAPENGAQILPLIEEALSAVQSALGDEAAAVQAQAGLLLGLLQNEGEPDPQALASALDDLNASLDSLPVQYKALFLPYYDNTWDSLESVYEAFVRDPMFVTEIVIVPIRRNTLEGYKFVYDDYLTPMGIPVTHYDEYDYTADLPDFVFYNNPYDAVALPKYHSQNIKPYAGCMVYIPYYLSMNEYMPKEFWDEQLQSKIGLPGHDAADIYIVQSESYKNQYGVSPKMKAKMVALGNPKIDCFVKQGRAASDIPAEWIEAAGGRKAVLLNSHYSLATGTHYKTTTFAALKYLLQSVSRSNDFYLIWRPHPQSFLLEQSDEFKQLIRAAFESGNIHLDRSSSVNTALTFCSAVITSRSSIVEQALIADKAVFMLSGNPEYDRMNWCEEPSVESAAESLKQIYRRILIFDKEKPLLHNAVYSSSWGDWSDSIDTEASIYAYCKCAYPFYRKEQMENVEAFVAGMRREYAYNPIDFFLSDLLQGIDQKQELRRQYVAQNYANLDGSCGESVLQYIKGTIGE